MRAPCEPKYPTQVPEFLIKFAATIPTQRSCRAHGHESVQSSRRPNHLLLLLPFGILSLMNGLAEDSRQKGVSTIDREGPLATRATNPLSPVYLLQTTFPLWCCIHVTFAAGALQTPNRIS
jgi:hypothetical protein